MDMYLPYIVSIVCALISGIVSYLISRKQMKTDLEKLNTQYKLDIKKNEKNFQWKKKSWNWNINMSLKDNKKNLRIN